MCIRDSIAAEREKAEQERRAAEQKAAEEAARAAMEAARQAKPQSGAKPAGTGAKPQQPGARVQPGTAQPQQPRTAGAKIHRVDTRGVSVDLSKYDERIDALVPDKANKMGPGKQKPVSYTHLDVYKRQLTYCAPASALAAFTRVKHSAPMSTAAAAHRISLSLIHI